MEAFQVALGERAARLDTRMEGILRARGNGRRSPAPGIGPGSSEAEILAKW